MPVSPFPTRASPRAITRSAALAGAPGVTRAGTSSASPAPSKDPHDTPVVTKHSHPLCGPAQSPDRWFPKSVENGNKQPAKLGRKFNSVSRREFHQENLWVKLATGGQSEKQPAGSPRM